MSTIFGVKDPHNGQVHEIAKRLNGGECIWINPIAPILPNETEVFAMDNDDQDIKIVGDIRDRVRNYYFIDFYKSE